MRKGPGDKSNTQNKFSSSTDSKKNLLLVLQEKGFELDYGKEEKEISINYQKIGQPCIYGTYKDTSGQFKTFLASYNGYDAEDVEFSFAEKKGLNKHSECKIIGTANLEINKEGEVVFSNNNGKFDEKNAIDLIYLAASIEKNKDNITVSITENDIKKSLERIHPKTRNLGLKLLGMIELESKCSIGCRRCYLKAGTKEINHKFSPEAFKYLINELDKINFFESEYAKYHFLSLYRSSEPFNYKSTDKYGKEFSIKDAIKMVSDRGGNTLLTTRLPNGSEELLEEIRKMPKTVIRISTPINKYNKNRKYQTENIDILIQGENQLPFPIGEEYDNIHIYPSPHCNITNVWTYKGGLHGEIPAFVSPLYPEGHEQISYEGGEVPVLIPNDSTASYMKYECIDPKTNKYINHPYFRSQLIDMALDQGDNKLGLDTCFRIYIDNILSGENYNNFLIEYFCELNNLFEKEQGIKEKIKEIKTNNPVIDFGKTAKEIGLNNDIIEELEQETQRSFFQKLLNKFIHGERLEQIIEQINKKSNITTNKIGKFFESLMSNDKIAINGLISVLSLQLGDIYTYETTKERGYSLTGNNIKQLEYLLKDMMNSNEEGIQEIITSTKQQIEIAKTLAKEIEQEVQMMKNEKDSYKNIYQKYKNDFKLCIQKIDRDKLYLPSTETEQTKYLLQSLLRF